MVFAWGLLFSPPLFSDMFVKDCCFLLHCFVEFSTEDTDSMLFFMRRFSNTIAISLIAMHLFRFSISYVIFVIPGICPFHLSDFLA